MRKGRPVIWGVGVTVSAPVYRISDGNRGIGNLGCGDHGIGIDS